MFGILLKEIDIVFWLFVDSVWRVLEFNILFILCYVVLMYSNWIGSYLIRSIINVYFFLYGGFLYFMCLLRKRVNYFF